MLMKPFEPLRKQGGSKVQADISQWRCGSGNRPEAAGAESAPRGLTVLSEGSWASR